VHKGCNTRQKTITLYRKPFFLAAVGSFLQEYENFMANLLFDLPEDHYEGPSLWQKGAVAITIGYIAFGLILIGIPSLSRGAVAIALLAFGWTLFGTLIQKLKFPPVLFLPLAFYIYALFSGVYLNAYPIEYMGQMTTIWIGAIALSVFVANGVALNLIIAGFFIMFVINMGAVAVGYDGHLINVEGEDLVSLQNLEVGRHSGLAGQSNLLVSLVFTLPFILFLAKKKVGFAVYVLVIAGAIVTTFLSGSRSAIALTVLFTLTGAIWLIANSTLRNLAILAGVGGAIMVTVFFNSEGAVTRVEQSRFGEEVLVKRVLAGLDGTEGESGELRKNYVADGWQYFFQKPIVGYGPDSFATVTGAGTYAHNNFVEIAVNWGVIGLVLYYLMYLVTLVRIGQKANYKLPMLATLLFLVISDLWFVTFLDRAMILCLCLLLVSVFAPTSQQARRRRRSKQSHHHTEALAVATQRVTALSERHDTESGLQDTATQEVTSKNSTDQKPKTKRAQELRKKEDLDFNLDQTLKPQKSSRVDTESQKLPATPELEASAQVKSNAGQPATSTQKEHPKFDSDQDLSTKQSPALRKQEDFDFDLEQAPLANLNSKEDGWAQRGSTQSEQTNDSIQHESPSHQAHSRNALPQKSSTNRSGDKTALEDIDFELEEEPIPERH